MRPNLRARRSMRVLIKTADVPPNWFDSAGRNHHRVSLVIEQCLATQVGWWVIWFPPGLPSFNLSQLLEQFPADIFRLRLLMACKPSGTETSRQKSDWGSSSRTESPEMRKRICCLFLLARSAPFFHQGSFILEDDRGYGDRHHLWHLHGSRWTLINLIAHGEQHVCHCAREPHELHR